MEQTSSAAGGVPPSDMALAFAVASLQAPKPATGDSVPLLSSSLQQQPVMSDEAVAAAAASVLSMGIALSSFPRQQQPRETAPPAMHSSMTPPVVATGTTQQSPSSHTRDDSSPSSSHTYTTHPERLAQTRERNKEHARKTRLRKKAHLQDLQGQVQTLQARHGQLQQQIQDCSIASILLGLSGNQNTSNIADDDTSSSTKATAVQQLLTQGRRRSPQSEQQQQEPLKLRLPGGKVLEIGAGHSNIHWKTGVYRDADGKQQKLTPQQLQLLR